MSTLDDMYLKEERDLKIYYCTVLLSELLKINYEYSNKEYNNVCGDDIFNIANRKEKFTATERNMIIENALIILKIKYGYIIRKDFISQYQNLDFKKESI